MYTARNFLFGLLAASTGVHAADAASDVAQLSKDTFEEFVKGNDLVLAECKSCFQLRGIRAVANTPRSLRSLVWSLQGPRA